MPTPEEVLEAIKTLMWFLTMLVQLISGIVPDMPTQGF